MPVTHISEKTGKNSQVTPEQILHRALEELADGSTVANAAIVLLIQKDEQNRNIITFRSNVTWDDEAIIYAIKTQQHLLGGIE